MTENAAQGDFLVLRELVLRNPPSFQELVHIVIQRKLARFGQTQRRQGRDRFADGTRLKEGVCGNRNGPALIGKTVAFRSTDPAVLDEGQRDTRDAVAFHLGGYNLVHGCSEG